ncbi:MAG: hypothetical protein SGBAC_004936 [Bacillariaceae sp.]
MFFRASSLLSTVALLMVSNANGQFLEFFGAGFCKDSEGLFFARGEAEKFDSPQGCLENCLLLDDADLVGFAYKFSNKRCHCNYNVGSEVIATCNREVFSNGCRSNQGYTGSGGVYGTDGPSSWNCYAYDPSPTFAPARFTHSTAEPTLKTSKKGAYRRNLQTSEE